MAKKLHPYRCHSSSCDEAKVAEEIIYLEESEYGKPTEPCPRCSGIRRLFRLTNVHLIVPKEGGPITGQEKDFAIACRPDLTNLGGMRLHYTDQGFGVTCQECVAEWEKIKENSTSDQMV